MKEQMDGPVVEMKKEAFSIDKKSQQKNGGLPWVQAAYGAPYFITEQGEDWTPIGQNDAITWPDLKGIFLRKDMAAAGAYFEMLQQHGITCIRLMLEYCHTEHRYFENPVGHFQPNMVKLWDDIFSLCEKYNIRVLLTPYDTFWMWLRWKHHPYKKSNGGICDKRSQWLLCANMRQAIKGRLHFVTERWGGSGALFAWDLWNEIHPAHSGNSVDIFSHFIEDISTSLRNAEIALHGRSHPQTVSIFSPVLHSHPNAAECIFKHPLMDFTTIHFYEKRTIDNPLNTVDAAIAAGKLTRECIAATKGNRPFFDSEHGPIHSFKDKNITLPEAFDDEYFRHMQWAHFASGGAGGGMRWPNRHPHSLTPGMRKAQHALALFLPFIHWQQFNRINLNQAIEVSPATAKAFACGDENQAVVWLLRTGILNKQKMQNTSAAMVEVLIKIPGLQAGIYDIHWWDTKRGATVKRAEINHDGKAFIEVHTALYCDCAIAITNNYHSKKRWGNQLPLW